MPNNLHVNRLQGDETIKSLARVLVEEVVPEEGPLFEHFAFRFFERPDSPPPVAVLEEEREGGSGMGVEHLIWTYIILQVLYVVLKPIGSGVTGAIQEVTKESFKEILRPHADRLMEAYRSRVNSFPAVRESKDKRLEEFLGSLGSSDGPEQNSKTPHSGT